MDVHLSEAYDSVDFFIIAEGDFTFMGNPKKMYFQLQAERYRRFWPKLLYVPWYGAIEGVSKTDHVNEDSQFNIIARPFKLLGLKPDDYFTVGCVDEIIESSCLRTLRDCSVPKIGTFITAFHVYSLFWRRGTWFINTFGEVRYLYDGA